MTPLPSPTSDLATRLTTHRDRLSDFTHGDTREAMAQAAFELRAQEQRIEKFTEGFRQMAIERTNERTRAIAAEQRLEAAEKVIEAYRVAADALPWKRTEGVHAALIAYDALSQPAPVEKDGSWRQAMGVVPMGGERPEDVIRRARDGQPAPVEGFREKHRYQATGISQPFTCRVCGEDCEGKWRPAEDERERSTP